MPDYHSPSTKKIINFYLLISFKLKGFKFILNGGTNERNKTIQCSNLKKGDRNCFSIFTKYILIVKIFQLLSYVDNFKICFIGEALKKNLRLVYFIFIFTVLKNSVWVAVTFFPKSSSSFVFFLLASMHTEYTLYIIFVFFTLLILYIFNEKEHLLIFLSTVKHG